MGTFYRYYNAGNTIFGRRKNYTLLRRRRLAFFTFPFILETKNHCLWRLSSFDSFRSHKIHSLLIGRRISQFLAFMLFSLSSSFPVSYVCLHADNFIYFSFIPQTFVHFSTSDVYTHIFHNFFFAVASMLGNDGIIFILEYNATLYAVSYLGLRSLIF